MNGRLPGRTTLVLWSLQSLVFLLALVLPCVGDAQTSSSRIVEVPLTVDYTAVSEAMRQQIYSPDGRALLWKGSGACEYLIAEHPVLSRRDPGVLLETDGHLSIGLEVGGGCVSPIAWNGIIQAESAPYVAGHMLRLRITDISLLNDEREKTLIAGKGFDLIKKYFIPRFETFEFDLSPATEQLRQLALAASPPDITQRVAATLATLRVLPEVTALDNGIRARIQFTLPSMPSSASVVPPATQLTAHEITAFETQLDQWDAFLAFAIKQLGSVNNDPQFRDDLLGLLLDSRSRLVEALENPQSGGADPVRLLFLDIWHQLGEIVRAAAKRGTLGDRSLQFLEFISAGDMLFALDQAAPTLGMRISAQDLRRLAHIVAPQFTGDPLVFTFAEDPVLQKLFGMGQPIESEGPLETEPIEVPSPAPGGPPAPPGAGGPSATESSKPTAANPARSALPLMAMSEATASPYTSATPSVPLSIGAPSNLEFLRHLLGPSTAYGSDLEPEHIADIHYELQGLGRSLKHVAVNSDNAKQYRADMEKLIEFSGLYAGQVVDSQYQVLYLELGKAVAWQESCWRQFVRKNNQVVYLESPSHDVGLMQINRYVWRGFYKVPRLEWDILYNSTAGMEILARLLRQVEKKPEAMTSGHPDELARSVYAAYNGGPSAYRRWRRMESHYSRVDRSFWFKYQAMSQGQRIDILSCAPEQNRIVSQ